MGLLYLIFDQFKKIGFNVFSNMEGKGDKFDQEYLVETSTKDFSDVKGLPEILGEFEQVVDLIKNKGSFSHSRTEFRTQLKTTGDPPLNKHFSEGPLSTSVI